MCYVNSIISAVLLIVLKHSVRGLVFFVSFFFFYTNDKVLKWPCKYRRYSSVSTVQPFLWSCSSEVRVKFNCCFPLYFLLLNTVHQSTHCERMSSLNPSGRLPTVLSEFLSFSATNMTSMLSSNGHVQCTACQLFPKSAAQNELQHCCSNLFLIAGNVQLFLNESYNRISCTGRINTSDGSPSVDLGSCSLCWQAGASKALWFSLSLALCSLQWSSCRKPFLLGSESWNFPGASQSV